PLHSGTSNNGQQQAHSHPQSDHSPLNVMSRIGSQFLGAASSVASTVKPSSATTTTSSSSGWSITGRLFGTSRPNSVQRTPPPSSSNAAALAPPPTPPTP